MQHVTASPFNDWNFDIQHVDILKKLENVEFNSHVVYEPDLQGMGTRCKDNCNLYSDSINKQIMNKLCN
jgi:hypothetical protein